MPSNGEVARRAIARKIVNSRFPIDDPDRVIENALDEPGEQLALADYLNRPIAHWIFTKTAFAWITVHDSELGSVHTVRDLGKLVLARLTPKPLPLADLTVGAFIDELGDM